MLSVVPQFIQQNLNLTNMFFTSIIIVLATIYFVVLLFSHNPREPFSEELEYLTIDEKGKHVRKPLSNTSDEQKNKDILLSVVVPSYNETKRIGKMLEDAINYLNEHLPNKWEIIIVDDGSSDDTSNFCLKLSQEKFNLKPEQLKVIKFIQNRGKGGAVKQGLLHVEGTYALFADADGASQFASVSKLINEMEKIEKIEKHTRTNLSEKPAVVIGSRAHMVSTDAVVKRSFIRNLLMYGFHGFVYVFGVKSIRDTQCGFKLFNRVAINEIIPFMHTEGWIFDVEILMLAMKKKIPIIEVPITWHEVDGSKMALARDSINMAKDLIVIRLAYLFGIYKDKNVI
ncbi:hypothetical protein TBLA_0A02190 [Henningerozyma blattae CBS 6284]|uniref:dolichyl-phosphate beta-glucosyltransferase n=1 Tax=Henningerozyma blattae (strain ATCC 34711 / CBS 6284 / DSM 70876 / NBRC 10599 / NRRL Y-10934 / UCD 77-7) TaxID=1071380 RepID=I2GV67_HENB6|nr:hypothetical protein TBLA_0A02190 [Tetrapisispora blattae CBS 6284]CCH58019.1 hypothetical protein TBLA_0A02190 [Tetrapisispora blattae CBS 6284]